MVPLASPPPPGVPWTAALAVFRKEMLETRRDRRTLIAAVLLPALTMPLVVLAIPVLLQRQQEVLRDRPARVAAVGGDGGGLVVRGTDDGAFVPTSVLDPASALRRGQIDAVLIDEGTVPGQPRRIGVLYDETRPASRAALQKATQVAARMALRDLERAARSRGVDPEGLIPVVIDPRNVATPEQMGGVLLANALPFFLAVWLLLGGQYAALDVGVGERERGTLEALLLTPPTRWAIVAGKFLAVLAPALLALGVMLGSAFIAVRLGAPLLTGAQVEAALPPGVVLPLLVVGTSLAGLLSASQLALSLAARTLREAQQAFTGLYLLVALPVMLEPFLGEALDGSWAPLVPVLNAVWTIRRMLIGEVDLRTLALTVGALVVATGPMLLWAARLLEGEARRIR